MASSNFNPAAPLVGVTPPAPPAISGRPGDPALDEFARQAGPDVSFDAAGGMVLVYTLFAVDPTTKKVRVAVVDHNGRLIRMIPPESVGEMLAAMASYGG